MLTRIFVSHVVRNRPALIKSLHATVLNVLNLRLGRPLNPVANNRTPKDANHRRGGFTTTTAHGITHSATGNSPHERTGT